MSHDDQGGRERGVQFDKEIGNHPSRLGIEVTRWFIAEQQSRGAYQGSGDSRPLAFTA